MTMTTAPRVIAANTTSGDATITNAAAGSFSSRDVGAAVTGAGIPADTTVVSVTSDTEVELSANATATATGVDLTFTGDPESYGFTGEVGETAAQADTHTVNDLGTPPEVLPDDTTPFPRS